jgi:hypothetical protein
MVDRGKQPDSAEARDDPERPRREPGRQRRGAGAEKEHRQHARRTPAVGEPACRQRGDAVQNEPHGGQRQKLAVGKPPLRLERQHDRGVEQHENMAVEVRDVGEQKRGSGGASGIGGHRSGGLFGLAIIAGSARNCIRHDFSLYFRTLKS